MELKHFVPLEQREFVDGFNRTFMELKRLMALAMPAKFWSFNRTFMELKQTWFDMVAKLSMF